MVEVASRLYEHVKNEPFESYVGVWVAYLEMNGPKGGRGGCSDSMSRKENKIMAWEAHRLLCRVKRIKRMRTEGGQATSTASRCFQSSLFDMGVAVA